MLIQKIKKLQLADGIVQLEMNGVMFSDITFNQDDGSPIRRLSMTDEALAAIVEAAEKGEVTIKGTGKKPAASKAAPKKEEPKKDKPNSKK